MAWRAGAGDALPAMAWRRAARALGPTPWSAFREVPPERAPALAEQLVLLAGLAWLRRHDLAELAQDTGTPYAATLRALAHGKGGVFMPENLVKGLWALDAPEYYAAFVAGRALADPTLHVTLALVEPVLQARALPLRPIVAETCVTVVRTFVHWGHATLRARAEHASFRAFAESPRTRRLVAETAGLIRAGQCPWHQLSAEAAEARAWVAEHGRRLAPRHGGMP